MTSNDTIFITLPISIISAIITIITTIIAVFVICNFFKSGKENTHPPSPPQVRLEISPPPASNSQVQGKSELVAVSSNSPALQPSYPRPSSSFANNSNVILSLSPQDHDTSTSRSARTNAERVKSTSPKKNHKHKHRTNTEKGSRDIQLYLSSCVVIFNALNTLCNTVFCVWLVVDPQDVDQYYVDHPSHTHRVTATVCWYIAKTLFVWMLCFRLYHSFKGSIFRVNKTLILFLGVTNTIVAPIALGVAYWAVYEQRHPMVEEVAFNTWRVLYQIIVFTILYMFCNRLLQLVIDNETYVVMKAKKNGANKTETTQNHARILQTVQRNRVSTEFLEVITRHSFLVLTVSTTVLMTTLCFAGFRFTFGQPTSITLLIPMNMAAVDSLITSICILCLFPEGRGVYGKLCRAPHACFNGVCLFFAKRTLTAF